MVGFKIITQREQGIVFRFGRAWMASRAWADLDQPAH